MDNPPQEKDKAPSELISLIEPINEAVKRANLQFQDPRGVRTILYNSTDAFQLLAKVDRSDFARVMSNILNNSVEAKATEISVTVSISEKNIVIEILDNGLGLDAKLLSKITEKGVTYNKPSGTGLGLWYVKKCVNQWGGQLEFKASLTRGMSVLIKIPAVEVPAWMAAAIDINRADRIVIVDDDPAIHRLWENRFREAMGPSGEPWIVHCYSPSALRNQVTQNLPNVRTLYLIDYDIKGSDENGAMLIESLGIWQRSVMVTGLANDLHVQKICEDMKVRILPKDLCHLVPLTVT